MNSRKQKEQQGQPQARLPSCPEDFLFYRGGPMVKEYGCGPFALPVERLVEGLKEQETSCRPEPLRSPGQLTLCGRGGPESAFCLEEAPGRRYTRRAFYRVCRRLCSGLYAMALDMTGGAGSGEQSDCNKRRHRPRSEYSLYRACDLFNRVLSWRFAGRLQGRCVLTASGGAALGDVVPAGVNAGDSKTIHEGLLVASSGTARVESASVCLDSGGFYAAYVYDGLPDERVQASSTAQKLKGGFVCRTSSVRGRPAAVTAPCWFLWDERVTSPVVFAASAEDTRGGVGRRDEPLLLHKDDGSLKRRLRERLYELEDRRLASRTRVLRALVRSSSLSMPMTDPDSFHGLLRRFRSLPGGEDAYREAAVQLTQRQPGRVSVYDFFTAFCVACDNRSAGHTHRLKAQQAALHFLLHAEELI